MSWAFGVYLLRGLPKVELEWGLVCLAYNLKRLHRMGAGRKMAARGKVSENRLRGAKSERALVGVAVGTLGRADPNRGSRLERPVVWPRIPHPTRLPKKSRG